MDNNNNVEYTTNGLVHAVQWGDLSYVEVAVDQNNFSPDTTDVDGCSLLHWAAINNRLEVAKYLISKGANVNSVGGNNMENPLQWALRCSTCTELLSLLISEEASITHKSIYGCDALMIAVQCNQLNASLVILNAGADPNTTDNNGDTPLYWMLRKFFSNPNMEFLELQRLLLRFNASVMHKSNDGCNALHLVAGGGRNFNTGSALLVYLAGSDSMLEAKNASKLTPYEVATESKNGQMVRFLWDAYMYRRLPFHLPTASIALCYLGAVVCLQWCGWLWGVLAIVPIYFLGELLSQPFISTGSSRLPCGLAWGIIVTAFSTFYTMLYDHIGPVCRIVTFLYAVTISYTMIKTTATAPLHLHCDSADSRNQLVQKMVEGERLGETFRFCTTCLVDRSLVSMHCSKCNKCVLSLDHHCPFVCNCVGRGNRRMFVLFLVSSSTGCMFFVLMSLYVQYAAFCPSATSQFGQLVAVQICMFLMQPGVFATTWITAITSMWIFALFLGQMGLIAAETSTFEVMKRGNQGLHAWCSGRGIRNVFVFLTSGTYSIISPSAPEAAPAACTSRRCSHSHGSPTPHHHQGHSAAPQRGHQHCHDSVDNACKSADHHV